MTENREAVGFEVFQHQHAIDRGRRTKGGDGILLEKFQGFLGVKFAAPIVDKECCALIPRAEQIAPRRLGPASFRHIPMQIAGPQIQPIFASDDVAQRIGGMGV